MDDHHWMRLALGLAEQGRGSVEPNPMVGAVLVRDGKIMGTGWHQRYGQAHAEVHALNEAGSNARGSTLYVTLEPCCHHGKTPPCTDAIIQAGIHRVVAAMADPFPRVAGGGIERLRQNGIPVEIGILEEESRRLNAPYLRLLQSGRPYVHVKWAMTLDGKIATSSGDSRWISNERSRERVHALRGNMDAIVVGIGTVLADDPQLTARPEGPRLATRIILDHQARIPLESILVKTATTVPMLVVTAENAPPERVALLRGRGCEVLAVADLNALLTELGNRRWTNILVEGGAGVLGSFLDARVIDEVHVFVAPTLAGGQAAPGPVGGIGVDRMKNAIGLERLKLEELDGDIYWHGIVPPSRIDPGSE